MRNFKSLRRRGGEQKSRIRVPMGRAAKRSTGERPANNADGDMPKVSLLRQFCAAFCVVALCSAGGAALAQSGNPAPPEQQKQQKSAADAAKEGQKSIDEIAEAARLITGPAGNPECVWLGRRVVSLLWRDDLDTAFRHLDLYDRFGCPSSHIQATFRCVVRQGHIDPKAQDSLNGRVHACWLNPTLTPTPPVTAAPPPAAAAGGTTPR